LNFPYDAKLILSAGLQNLRSSEYDYIAESCITLRRENFFFMKIAIYAAITLND
jgi:hypothetical protein